MFKTRLLSGILLVIIALITVITGGNLLFLVLLAVSLIGMTELYKVFAIGKKAPGIVGYAFAVLYYALLYFEPVPLYLSCTVQTRLHGHLRPAQ